MHCNKLLYVCMCWPRLKKLERLSWILLVNSANFILIPTEKLKLLCVHNYITHAWLSHIPDKDWGNGQKNRGNNPTTKVSQPTYISCLPTTTAYMHSDKSIWGWGNTFITLSQKQIMETIILILSWYWAESNHSLHM